MLGVDNGLSRAFHASRCLRFKNTITGSARSGEANAPIPTGIITNNIHQYLRNIFNPYRPMPAQAKP